MVQPERRDLLFVARTIMPLQTNSRSFDCVRLSAHLRECSAQEDTLIGRKILAKAKSDERKAARPALQYP
jgi:hypothetical protein